MKKKGPQGGAIKKFKHEKRREMAKISNRKRQ
jgi:hypothetical protein